MEILATNVDYSGFIIPIIFAILAVLGILGGIITKDGGGLLGLCIGTLFLSAIIFFFVGKEVTYDAIITDWNEVYEQGYEIVEQNGKIVTLRKVDE